ncbi:MAG: SAM-dependent methyltransferase [Alphaproteobacteria bacterium]|jgi:type I restriction-modification system DNA methylase subunit|nr:SAM-dependent methyltransferase [Alphaproteobacteria bacterium]
MIKSRHDILKDLYKDIETIQRKSHFNQRTILDDFCTIAMGSHHNMLYTLRKVPVPNCYKKQFDYFEKEYESIVKKYDKYEGVFDDFVVLLCKLTQAMTENPADYLGEIYMLSNSNSKCNGQFFTPHHVCGFMGKLVYGTKESFETTIKENGYLGFNDPACGSGALAIGFNSLVDEYGIKNPDIKILYYLNDIDFTCIKMAFLNMTLMGLSARLEWGDALFDDGTHMIYDTPCLQIALRMGYFQSSKKEKSKETNVVINESIREQLNKQMELF